MTRCKTIQPAPAVLLLVVILCTSVSAQEAGRNRVYQPVDQYLAPGVATQWAAVAGKFAPGGRQLVRIQLPSSGTVTFYGESPLRMASAAAPAQVGLFGGYLYRFQIHDMPEFPGVELYPTVELVDRLHPPAGKEEKFPIPVAVTREEIELALEGRFVTKVVYLEQPQLALPRELDTANRVLTVAGHKNLLTEADLLGRPLLILRLGDRIPDSGPVDPTFFGRGAPLEWPRTVSLQEPNDTSSERSSSQTVSDRQESPTPRRRRVETILPNNGLQPSHPAKADSPATTSWSVQMKSGTDNADAGPSFNGPIVRLSRSWNLN